jgi:hypothetical protein
MMILWRERLAFLAVPKTGTTAIESILAPFAAITYSRPPMVKHMTLSKGAVLDNHKWGYLGTYEKESFKQAQTSPFD